MGVAERSQRSDEAVAAGPRQGDYLPRNPVVPCTYRGRRLMRTFLFTGTLRRSRVVFQIEAEDLDEARKLALRGEFDGFDDTRATLDDWMINPETGNEAAPA